MKKVKMLSKFKRMKNKVKYFIQRGKRGYDDTSYWSARRIK